MSHISAEEATQLLADATPGPWTPGGDVLVDDLWVDSDDGVICIVDVGERQAADTALIAAAPRLAAEVVRLRRWQDEAMAVLAEWDNVHDALGQPGDLGQSKALASHFEVVRLRRELDARTDHEPEAAAAPILRHGVYVRHKNGLWESYIDGNYIADHSSEAEAWAALGVEPPPTVEGQ